MKSILGEFQMNRLNQKHFWTNLLSLYILFVVLSLAGCGNTSTGHGFERLKKTQDTDSKTHISSAEEADVLFSLARSAEKQANFQEAIKLYQVVIQKNPKSGDAFWRMAVCLDKSGNFQKSAAHFRDAIKLMPGNPEIFCDYGYSLALQKRWNNAEMNLKQSIAIQPELKRAHNNLGMVLAQGSKVDEARREFQIGGLSLPDAHWNLAQILISQSRWEEARDEFKKIKSLTPNDASVDRQLASLNRLVGKVELARRGAKSDQSVARASADAIYLK
jgi:Flp pilus assembly protein TadD